MIVFFIITWIYPLSLLSLALASVLMYRATLRPAAIAQSAGFAIALIGNLLANFGPKSITYTESADAIIEVSSWVSAALWIGPLGIIVAASASLMLAWQLQASKSQAS